MAKLLYMMAKLLYMMAKLFYIMGKLFHMKRKLFILMGRLQLMWGKLNLTKRKFYVISIKILFCAVNLNSLSLPRISNVGIFLKKKQKHNVIYIRYRKEI